MLEYLVKGGPVIVPIALTSVVALGIFLERLWSLNQRKIIPESFVKRIEELVLEQRLGDALLLCQENTNPMANIMAAGLRSPMKQRGVIKEAVEEVGKYEGAVLERYIEIIGTCAAISPLLGLLGTVVGMMEVFQQVEITGLGDPSAFASGIWQALITTAIGLSVAIPSYIFYKYLLAKVDTLIIEMEERSLYLVDLISKTP